MSYQERDKTKIEGYKLFFSLSDGSRVRVASRWNKDEKEVAERETLRLPGGKISPIYGWKTVMTDYPTCPVCGHQGKSSGIKDFNYNGGGEQFHCLNPDCNHKWTWS